MTSSRRISSLIVAIAMICGVVALASAPSGAAARWSIVPSVSPIGAPFGSLSGVSCSSTTDCFAVGEGGSGTLIEHWNGTNWTIVPSPNPAGQPDDELNGVSCSSATSCFAVGDAATESLTAFSVKTMILRWNGTTWSIVPSPTPSTTDDVTLSGVSCSSPTDCFAVGSSSTSPISLTSDTVSSTSLIEHWDGTSWSIVASPNPASFISAELFSVSCPSSTTCFAAGDFEASATGGALLEQWNGISWSIVASPDSTSAVTSRAKLRMHRRPTHLGRGRLSGADPFATTIITGGLGGFESSPSLESVSCVSVVSCFAVGVSFTGALTERFDGTGWTIVSAPTPRGSDGADLVGVSCASSTDCSAVGTSDVVTISGQDIEESPGPLEEHWNGTSWAVVAGPKDSSIDQLGGVSCPSSTSCFAVGDSTFVQHWNGTSWSIAPLSSKTSQSALAHVACPSATSCFAVGSSGSFDDSTTLIERWNGVTWSVVPSPSPSGAFDTSLNDVSCASTTNCFAVGSVDGEEAETALTEHWNGAKWSIVPAAKMSAAQVAVLGGVSCPTASDCVAVGIELTETAAKTLIEQWNGKTWSVVKAPSPSAAFLELVGVTCTSTTDCTAVGSTETSVNTRSPGAKTLIEHFDGTSWTIVPSVQPTTAPFAILGSVSCSAATNCNAVGFDAPSEDGADRPLAEHWNGTAWTLAAVPTVAGAKNTQLLSLSCRSASSCYAVGASTVAKATSTLVEHWNGASWSIVPSANPSGTSDAALDGVSCPSPATCIAVGSYAANDGNFTLSERGS